MSSSPFPSPQMQQQEQYTPVSPQSQIQRQQQNQPSSPVPSGPPPAYAQTAGYPQQQVMMSNFGDGNSPPRAMPGHAPAGVNHVPPQQVGAARGNVNIYLPPAAAAQRGWCPSGQHVYMMHYGVSIFVLLPRFLVYAPLHSHDFPTRDLGVRGPIGYFVSLCLVFSVFALASVGFIRYGAFPVCFRLVLCASCKYSTLSSVLRNILISIFF